MMLFQWTRYILTKKKELVFYLIISNAHSHQHFHNHIRWEDKKDWILFFIRL